MVIRDISSDFSIKIDSPRIYRQIFQLLYHYLLLDLFFLKQDKRIVAEIIYGGAKAKAGSIASYKQFADIWKSVDSKAGDNFFTKYEAADKIFKEEQKKIQKQKDVLRKVKMPTNKKISEYDHYVAIVSAENIINSINQGNSQLIDINVE